MHENLKTFLTQIGVNQETIDKLSNDPEEGQDPVDVAATVTTWNATKKDLLTNDPDFINGIKKEIRGKELATAENKVKRVFGLTTEEMEGKNYEEILGVAMGKVKGSAGAGTEELEGKLLAANNELKALKEETIPGLERSAQEQIQSFHRKNKIQAIIGSHSLTVDAQAISPAIHSFLSEKYDITMGEDGNLVTKTKDGLAPLSTDGTSKLTLDQIIKGKLEEFKVIKQSNGGGSGSGGTGAQGGSGSGGNAGQDGPPKFQPPGLKAAQANQRDLGEMRQV